MIDWSGQDCFVVGGGRSLRGFVWPLLYDERVVGCNDAYQLDRVCDVVAFGDKKWWDVHHEKLSKFSGEVWTNLEALGGNRPDWVNWRQRSVSDLPPDELGWFGHTGALAMHLALTFGAKCVYLLGFDMKPRPDGSNWHDGNVRPEATGSSAYALFLDRWPKFLKAFSSRYSGRELINVTDDSDLFGVPQISVNDFWERRLKWNGYNNTQSSCSRSSEQFTRSLGPSLR